MGSIGVRRNKVKEIPPGSRERGEADRQPKEQRTVKNKEDIKVNRKIKEEEIEE